MAYFRSNAPLLAALGLAISPVAMAGFIEDSKGSLELRNHYLNRDFRQSGAPQAKAEEWGQGFT
ncbi:MAG: OprD family outer membrane porin, partial [Pseudomonas sp.]